MGSAKLRCNEQAFLRKGLDVLADDGPGSLTAARVSKDLNVTTGSFYWHFRSVDEFHSELKKFWLNEILIPLIGESRKKAKKPADVLEIISQSARQRGIVRYDRAMRSWANSDKEVKKIVRAADEIRRKLIKDTLLAKGESQKSASDKTDLFGAAWLGTQTDPDLDHRFKLLGMITGDKNSQV